MRQLLSDACHGVGDVEVDQAQDGLDALKRLATARYDLIFIDINMPMFDGLKLIRKVRSTKEQQRAKICVCTTDAESQAPAWELGANYFLQKPVNRRQVEMVLHDALHDPQGRP